MRDTDKVVVIQAWDRERFDIFFHDSYVQKTKTKNFFIFLLDLNTKYFFTIQKGIICSR